MMRMRVGVGGFALALGAVAFLVARAPAQDYPQRAVTIIVPYPPGGATDLMTRILAEGLRERFKQSFVVENRPGAGTLIGAATLAKSGGRLVYATCSPEPEENEAVVAAFLAAHPAWRVDPPVGFPLPLDADGYLRTRPDRHGIDGFTAVRLRRA